MQKHRPLYSRHQPIKPPEKKKRKWTVLPIIWAAAKRMFMVLGAMVFFSTLISVYALSNAVKTSPVPSLPDEMILHLELEGELHEVPPAANFADPFAPVPPTLREMVAAIDAASEDDRVKALVANMKFGSFQLAQVQELRAAVKRFRETGKPTIIYSNSFGMAGGGLGRYYLASAFEEIWMQPMGVVSIPGIFAEMPFARDALDKVGVTPQFLKRKDYKTAYESLTNSEMSPENREMISSLVQDFAGTLVAEIAADRGFDGKNFVEMVHQGLFTSDQALDAGLIDKKAYADMLEDRFDDAEPVRAGQYLGGAKVHLFPSARKNGVALIYAVGAIMEQNAGGNMAASEDIVPAINRAADDENIKAIVLRIDSPGGSPVASDDILRALELAKEKGKKIIVSMGGTAASGGYWIAANADQIFVSQATITGSIGVIGGKFSAGDLWEKIGVNWDGVKWGKNAGMWSLNSEFDESETAQIDAMLDHVYDAFITRVAKGRGMEKSAVDAIAGGRVWSGKAALYHGLADQEGGLKEALNYTAQLVTGDAEASTRNISIRILPEPKNSFERLLELLGAQAKVGVWAQKLESYFSLSNMNAAAYEPVQIR